MVRTENKTMNHRYTRGPYSSLGLRKMFFMHFQWGLRPPDYSVYVQASIPQASQNIKGTASPID